MEDEPNTYNPARSSELPTPPASSSVIPLSDKDDTEEAYARYQETWDLAHLDDAIILLQRASDAAPEPNASLLGGLGLCLEKRYEVQGKLDDLERGIAAEQDALQLTSDEHPDKALRLNNLSSSLLRRYERLGELDDLKSALKMQSRSVELTPANHPDLSARLDNLGYLYRLRYERFGELDDLERPIANQQRAVDLAPDDHPNKPIHLNNLGLSLCARFERLGEPVDLERAITAQRRAVALTPEGHPEMPKWLANLGELQRLRYERFGDLEDLERAIAGQQRAVKLTPDGHPFKPTGLNNLGISLRRRFERLGEPDDLERAITAQRRAVELTPGNHPNMPTYLANLGYMQRLRYERYGDLEDLEQAIAGQRRAVQLTPHGHPKKPRRLNVLAYSLAAYFDRNRTTENFNRALSCYTAATSQSLYPPAERLRTAQSAVSFLQNNSDFSTREALMLAHSHILDIVPELVWLGHNLRRRLEESKHLGKLVNAAVCAAIGAGALAQAIEWSDAGKALIWTQALALRNPLDELEQFHPVLARSLHDVHAQLRSSFHVASHRGTGPTDDHALPLSAVNLDGDHHRGLAIKYGKLIVDIRGHSGFESFMLPQKLSALLPSSTLPNGPVVFINVHQMRCDALILQQDGAIVLVALPGLSVVKAETLRSKWQSHLLQHNVRERTMAVHRRYGPREHSEVVHIFSSIWNWIVGPVLQELGLIDIKSGERLPHITWCPTGPLTQLPLHAAGIYSEDGGPRAYNFVVSSYTPSLSALTRSVDALAKQHTTSGILVVTQPATPGLQPLPGTTIEGEHLRETLSGTVALSIFDGEQATTGIVKQELADKPWLHLACHGSQNVADPLQSAFALHDGPLSLADLMATTAENAEIAFLSACQTAVGDETMPEESMHLAAGMLAVGYKGVIATMWSIKDHDAPVVVEAYYRKLLELRASGSLGKGETGAAYALHEAAKRLREKIGEKEVSRWAPFVHFGI